MRPSVRTVALTTIVLFLVLLFKNRLSATSKVDGREQQPPAARQVGNGPESPPAERETTQNVDMIDSLAPDQRIALAKTAALPSQTYESIPIDTPNDRVIVMAKLAAEDTAWVSNELHDWRNVIYIVDNPSAKYHTPTNKGRESLAYLQYIVDHYDSLPKLLLFLHSHRNDPWHTDTIEHSNIETVRAFRPDFVQEQGYVNLRCASIPGCPAHIQPFRNPPDPFRETEVHFAQAYQELFNVTGSDVPWVVASACCSQFAVSRDQVLRRPLSDYERFYHWVLDSELPDPVISGIMEYTWHMIFGKEPVQYVYFGNYYLPPSSERFELTSF